MSIGDAEIKTQERVIRFFKDPEILGYQYIGNLSDYQNKNIKEDRLRQYLRLKGYADKLIDAAIMLMLSSRIKLTPNTLLFNKLNVRQRRVWLVKDCSNNSVCSSEFLPYKSEKIDLSFLKQLLLTDKVTKDFEDMSSGTSNSQQRITPSDFLKYEISIPSLEEQRKIALILFDMDTEIQRLEEKLSKYQKVKQGMMEELLTGKVRLM